MSARHAGTPDFYERVIEAIHRVQTWADHSGDTFESWVERETAHCRPVEERDQRMGLGIFAHTGAVNATIDLDHSR